MKGCSVSLRCTFIDHIVDLYVMSPLCLIDLILNVIILMIVSDHPFKNWHRITLVVCIISLVYKVSECSNLTVTSIAETKAYKYFDFCKEIIFHFIRICILVCVNFPLLSTLHTASKKLKTQRRSSESIILASPTARFQSITMILM
ncbi:unnamed protein product [Rotaria socialis]|uniref:Uncharacterized protein n=1 Tax=Rotaria socialis TaxID=392032 RepID=A0A821SH92_9BILA|nr:unnamed protein product [Rotaria socialis]